MLEIGKHVFIAGFITDFTTSPPTTAAPTPIACDAFGAVYTHLVAGAAAGGGAVSPLSLVPIGTDAVVPTLLEGIPTFAAVELWRGAGNNVMTRAAAASAGNANPTPGSAPAGVQIVTPQAEWSLPHTPAVATRATITQAAVATARHVCKGIHASLSVAAADVAVAGILVNLRDGATGAGTILWSQRLAVVVAGGGLAQVNIADLNITGSVNTAMTLEFAAAPGAASFETVTLSGITINQ